jgi:hypothetical protein
VDLSGLLGENAFVATASSKEKTQVFDGVEAD